LNCSVYLYHSLKGPGFSGFNKLIIAASYEYPEYLVEYKNIILELVKKNEEQYKDYVNYMNYQDDSYHPLPSSPPLVTPSWDYHYERNCIYDVEINLSPYDSEVYSDSDYDY